MVFWYIICFLSSYVIVFFFFKQKTAYEMRISDWSSDVCSSDLLAPVPCGSLSDLARVAAPVARQHPGGKAHLPADQQCGDAAAGAAHSRDRIARLLVGLDVLVETGGEIRIRAVHIVGKPGLERRRNEEGGDAEIGRASWGERGW